MPLAHRLSAVMMTAFFAMPAARCPYVEAALADAAHGEEGRREVAWGALLSGLQHVPLPAGVMVSLITTF